jgi:hypothetical protein
LPDNAVAIRRSAIFNLVGVNSPFLWGGSCDLQCGAKPHEQICFDTPSALRQGCSFIIPNF